MWTTAFATRAGAFITPGRISTEFPNCQGPRLSSGGAEKQTIVASEGAEASRWQSVRWRDCDLAG